MAKLEAEQIGFEIQEQTVAVDQSLGRVHSRIWRSVPCASH